MSHLKELSDIKKAIRRKVSALRSGERDSAALLEKTYRPIIEPLRELASVSADGDDAIVSPQASSTPYPKGKPKIEQSTLLTEYPTSLATTSKIKHSLEEEEEHPTNAQIAHDEDDTYEDGDNNDHPSHEISEEIDESAQKSRSYIETLPSKMYQHFYEQFNNLPRYYVEGLTNDTKQDYDLTYGVRFDPDHERWLMGNKEIRIDGDDLYVVIGPKVKLQYRGTPGLYELVFKKRPIGYTDKDKIEYADLLSRTNSYRQRNNPNLPVKGSNTHKYRNIIKPLLEWVKSTKKPTKRYTTVPAKRMGKGGYDASLVADERREKYVYFDDYNELVDRLRLLHASQEAGNTSHDNEVASIIEELREAGIIY